MELAESDAASLNLLLKVGNYYKLCRVHIALFVGLGFLKGHRGAGVSHRVFSSKRNGYVEQ